MSENTKLLACGLVCADITFRVHEMPRRAEKYRAESVRFSLGGGGAIAAVAMQRLGAEVQLAGRLGDDLFGDLLREEVVSRFLGHTLLSCVPGGQSPISSVFVDDSGDRQIVNYREVDDAFSQVDVSSSDDVLATLPKFDAVIDEQQLKSMDVPDAILVDTRWEAAAIQMLAYARRNGIPGVIDGEAPVSHAGMALASHVAFSRQGLRDYAGVDDIEQGLRQAQAQFHCWVCVTDGDEGVYELNKGELLHTPAFVTKAVDTLGAGDVWHAAFTLQIAREQPESKAIIFANAAAALKCGSDKGLDGIPSSAEVQSFLHEKGLVI